tara:strand:+ start:1477 stop:1737 length:261 start_codon:yes stop_codon:yes gene_type:complete
MKMKGSTDQVVDVEAQPLVDAVEKVNDAIDQLPDENRVVEYELNRSAACMRRFMKLKLSDKELTDMLSTHQGRKQFGYMYLKQKVN